MKTPSPSSEPESGIGYRWFKVKAGSYTGTGGKWTVLVGCAFTTQTAPGNLIVIQDKDQDVIDQVSVANATSVGFEMEWIPRRMLIPPLGIITGTVGAAFSLIECDSLSLALAIL